MDKDIQTATEQQAQGATSQTTEKQEQTPAQEPQSLKKYDDEDLNRFLAKEKRKWEAKATEATKLAQMSAEEKARHELESKQQELQQREAELIKRELITEAKTQFTSKSLPVELVDILDFTDADTCKTSMATVEKVFTKAVNAEVTRRMSGPTPKTATESDPINYFGLGAKVKM